jgi:hypothetical protein
MSSIATHFYGDESYEDIYAVLARVFPVRSYNESSWIEVRVDDLVSMTFFAPKPAPVATDA